MTVTACSGTPRQIGLIAAELQPTGRHPRRDVIQTRRQKGLQHVGVIWQAGSVHLGGVGAQVRLQRTVHVVQSDVTGRMRTSTQT